MRVDNPIVKLIPMPLDYIYKVDKVEDDVQESLNPSQPTESSSVTLPGTINSPLSPLRPHSLLKGAGVNRKKTPVKKPKSKSTLRNKGKRKKAVKKKKNPVKPKRKKTKPTNKKSSVKKRSKPAKSKKKTAKKSGKK